MKTESLRQRGMLIYGAMLLVLVYVTRVQELFAFLTPLHMGKVSVLLALLLYFISPAPQVNISPWRIPQVKMVLVIFALSLLSVPFSFWTGLSFDRVVRSWPLLLLFFFMLIYAVNTIVDLRKLLWSFIIGVFFLAFFTITSGAVGRAAASAMYDPNDIALLFVITLPIIYFFVSQIKGPARLLLLGILITVLFAFIFTVSRGGFIGLIAIVLLILFKDKYRSWFVKLLVLAVMAVVFIQLAPETYWDRIGTILTYEEDYNITERGGRWDIWSRGLRLMTENPVTGVGVGAFAVGLGHSYGDEGGQWLTAHNAFIQIGAELGFGGFFVFILLIATSIYSLRRMRYRYERQPEKLHDRIGLITAVEISLWGYVVTAMFLSAAYFPMFYFLIALCCILKKLEVIEHEQARLAEGRAEL